MRWFKTDLGMGEAAFLRQVQLFRYSHLTLAKYALCQTCSKQARCCRTTFIWKKFQFQTFPLTSVFVKIHGKDPKSYESSKELLPNIHWLSVYFHLVCLFSTWNERQITNDEMKFLLALESNRFPKYLMVNVVNTFNKNIICRHLIVTSNFPQK